MEYYDVLGVRTDSSEEDIKRAAIAKGHLDAENGLTQNLEEGRAEGSTARIIKFRSIRVPAFHAANIPVAIPMMVDRITTWTPREIVGCNLGPIRKPISRLEKYDSPRSPWSSFQNHSPIWTGKGRSKPRS